MGEIIMRIWDLREFCVRVNLWSPIWQVCVPIRCAITPIQGLPNPFRQVVPLISHIHSYPPQHTHLNPPSLCLIFNSTIIAEYNVKSSLSISLCHDHELTLSIAYTKYSVSNGSRLPGCSPGLEPDRMVQSGLLPGNQGYPLGLGTGLNRTAVPFNRSYNFGSNLVFEFWSDHDMVNTQIVQL